MTAIWWAISGFCLGLALWAWRLTPWCWPRHPWGPWQVLEQGKYSNTKRLYMVQGRQCTRCGTHQMKTVD